MSRLLRRLLPRGRLTAETRGLARDSSALGLSSAVAMVGYTALVALLTHALGLETYGIFVVVVASVDLVNRFLDVQIGQVAIAFAAEDFDRDPRRAAGILQFSYLVDLLGGVLGFAIVAAVAPFVAGRVFDADTSLFVLYALVLLATTVETTSLAVLRLADRFGLILQLTIVREGLRVLLVGAALLAGDSLARVIVALVAVEAVASALWLASATRTFRQRTGRPLFAHALDAAASSRRPMIRMAMHTNIVSYVKILSAQGPTLLLGGLRGPTDAGAFKIGTAVAAVVAKPADVAWAAVLPRFARLRSAGRFADLRGLVRQASLLALGIVGGAGLVVILLREPIVRVFAGDEAAVAATVVVFAVLQKVVNGVLFWNTPLVVAFKRADLAARVAVVSALLATPVLVAFTEHWGAAGAAAAMLIWALQSNLALAAIGLRLVSER